MARKVARGPGAVMKMMTVTMRSPRPRRSPQEGEEREMVIQRQSNCQQSWQILWAQTKCQDMRSADNTDIPELKNYSIILLRL